MDAGGYFPETDKEQDLSWFEMDLMKLVGVDAAGVGDRDLRFGSSYLVQTAKSKKLDLVCANLVDRTTRQPIVQPFLIKKVGNVQVGIFGLISDKVDLGPSRDSLLVKEPPATAEATVAALRKKGAQVIVLLSQLGKVESEDLVTTVDGIDVIVVGRNVPLLQKGRLIKSTVAVYGGEQGQYIGRTALTLGPKGTVASGDAETYMLGPEVGEVPEIATIVKAFDDSHNEKLRKQEKEAAAKEAASQLTGSPDRYLGSAVCQRCHQEQFAQWSSTKHATAWKTLVDDSEDKNSACVGCHVVGYQRPGGFTSAADTPQLVNVGCEMCHGQGSAHDAFPAHPAPVTEAACRTCHNAERSPKFDYATYVAKIKH